MAKKRGKRSQRYHWYKRRVKALTKQNVGKIGWPPPNMERPTIDHIVPRQAGFTMLTRHLSDEEAAERIGSAENLQWLSFQDNLKKGARVTEQGHALIEKWTDSY